LVMLIAHIVLPVHLNRHFDYLLTEQTNAAVVGGRVRVSFGKRQMIGLVTAIDQHSELTADKLKPILEVLDSQPLFSGDMWHLLNWAAKYYHYPLGEVLFHALPVLLRQGRPAQPETITVWSLTAQGRQVDV